MSDVFDPYRQWLDLDLAHPPRNHYELLGLTANQPDANTIVNARDRMLKKLRDVQPQERGNEWEQLVEQVYEASRHLLACDVLADEDQQQSRSVPIAAPPATIATQGLNQAVPVARLVSATLPTAPPVETSPAVAENEIVLPRPVVTGRPSRYRRRSVWSLWVLPLILVVILGVVSYQLWYVVYPELRDELPAVSQTDGLPTDVPQTDAPRSGRDQQGADDPGRQSTPGDDQPGATGAKMGTKSDQDRQAESRPRKVPVPARPPRGETLDLSDEEQETVRKILAALAREEFDGATDSIKTLTATNPQMGDSLNVLKIYVVFYWEGIEEAWQALGPGRELHYRGRKVMVVERGERELVVRASGRNETIDVKPIEPWLEKQLADGWFDRDDAANWVSIGAREFVRPGGDLQQVRHDWQRAARAGEPADRLLGLLEWSHLRP
jgi:hypothetical protein